MVESIPGPLLQLLGRYTGVLLASAVLAMDCHIRLGMPKGTFQAMWNDLLNFILIELSGLYS